MNHVEFYEQTSVDSSNSFEIRHYLREFHKYTFEEQSKLLSILNTYNQLRIADFSRLNESVTYLNKGKC